MGNGNISESLVIIDDNKFRRAAIASLLQPWAEGHSVEIAPMCVSAIPSAPQQYPAVRLILVNLGGDKVCNPFCQHSFRVISAVMPDTPVVIVSDIEDGEDVIAAFSGGAQGFLPTSLEPEIALQALSFIFNGGSFFPSSALRYLNDKSQPHSEHLICSDGAQDGCVTEAGGASGRPLSQLRRNSESAREPAAEGLTERQQHVLRLLRTGLSNKMIARELGMTEATVKVHVRHVMRKLGVSNRTEAAIIATSLLLETVDAAPASQADDRPPPSIENGRSRRISVRLYSRFSQSGSEAAVHDWEMPANARPNSATVEQD